MLPVARKPVVEYVIDELAANGIEQILFVTGRNKTSIEDHFDLGESAVTKFFYTRQGSPRGLGDAVLAAEHFAGDDPFVVALGDSILGLHAKCSNTTPPPAWSRSRKFLSQRPASTASSLRRVLKTARCA
jgi:UTP--glucose-1-phosphate uridylyltransferase